MKKRYFCLPFLLFGSLAGLEYMSINECDAAAEASVQVETLYDVYGEWIQGVARQGDDYIFEINGDTIHFQDGRLLRSSNLHKREHYNSHFYPYQPGRYQTIPPLREKARLSADFWESLFGTSERDVRKKCGPGQFLHHFVFLNNVCLEPLKAVEQEIFEAARTDSRVQKFIDELDIVYSFQQRRTKGYRENTSLHSFGLALDLVPESYGRKQVFWRWSRVFNRDTWYQIPLEKRWSPPQAVIAAFERNGFVWGGKWVHFDTIHFEYRPEIVRQGLQVSPVD